MTRVTLVLPWGAVAHDNHRLIPARGRLIANPTYANAKATAETLLLAQFRAARAKRFAGRVQLVAVAYFPDARKRDAGNYRKLVTDALSGIAYDDDAQLWREVWERGGVDRDRPRVEITLSEYAA